MKSETWHWIWDEEPPETGKQYRVSFSSRGKGLEAWAIYIGKNEVGAPVWHDMIGQRLYGVCAWIEGE